MKILILSLMSILLASCGAASNGNPVVDNCEGDRCNDPNNRTNQGLSVSSSNIRTQMNRRRGVKTESIKTIQDLSKAANELAFPEGYNEVPNEQNYEQVVQKIDYANYTLDCGILNTIDTTLQQRISSCVNVYFPLGIMTKWESTKHGISGEGNWVLVSVTTKPEKKIVWLDQTTGLLWSDFIENATWTNAADSERRTCKDYITQNTHFFDKSQVVWRLPTRSDFLQADINGARFVLRNTNANYWSASAVNNDLSWSIAQSTGSSTQSDKTTSLAVRCVGVSLK